MNPQAKKDALEFLKSQRIGVLSTISGSQPQSAFVYYIVEEDLSIYLYFMTLIGTRKYNNIQLNKKVSFVVGAENPPRTVQIDGTVQEVTDEKAIKDVTAHYLKVVVENNHYPPPPTKLNKAGKSSIAVFKIIPHWLRWSDFSGEKKDYTMPIVLIDNIAV